EATPLRPRPGLGTSHAALRGASRFARVLARNPPPVDRHDTVYALLPRALDAWATALRPDAILLKGLILLALAGAHFARQERRAQLDAADRAPLDRILREPAAEQSTPPRDVARLASALEEYLRQTTAMRFGE